jgi:hypothetical protein
MEEVAVAVVEVVEVVEEEALLAASEEIDGSG